MEEIRKKKKKHVTETTKILPTCSNQLKSGGVGKKEPWFTVNAYEVFPVEQIAVARLIPFSIQHFCYQPAVSFYKQGSWLLPQNFKAQ